jgi:hypothetical protein
VIRDRSVLQRCDGAGPVETRVVALLRDRAGGEFSTSIAPRSPLGPRAVRVQLKGAANGSSPDAWQELARLLEEEPWVDAVAPRRQQLYLRVTSEALRSWVADGLGGERPAGGDEGAGRPVVVRLGGAAASGSLGAFRCAAAARSVAALLRSRGFQLEADTTGDDDSAMAAVGGGAPIVVVGEAPGPLGERVVHAEVGEVDVRHGALRARHGGSVSAEDVLGEIRAGLAPAGAGEDYAERLLAFLLLREPRARRVQLDDERLLREAVAFESVLGARAAASGREPGDPPAGGADQAARELAAELDLLPVVAARAASDLEPALLVRFVRAVAERAHAAGAHLGPDDPLWPATAEAIDAALGLTGLEAA